MRALTFPLLLVVSLVGLTACEEDQVEVPERIRSIKTFTVTEAAGGNVRVFPGSIVAADTSSLSFSAAGTVATVLVDRGDKVKAGQVLATLDPKPFELDVDVAKSQLKSAQANFDEKALELTRQRTLFSKKIVAKAALDKAAAAASTAEGDVDVARARLAQLERDLTKTKLTAPYDAVIASRDVEPFNEVAVGKSLFVVNSEGAYELEFTVPDSAVGRVVLGQKVAIDVGSLAACGCQGLVSQIGTVSGAANSVTVSAVISDPPSDLLPGTSAKATILFAGRGTTRGYLIPIVAVAAPTDGSPAGAHVFKYSADSGSVSRVTIKAGEGRDNLIEVTEGVELGDVIAAAGVSLLRDGQKVKPLAN